MHRKYIALNLACSCAISLLSFSHGNHNKPPITCGNLNGIARKLVFTLPDG
jgi:hypothetical protein